jgi:thioredoxin-like negative regulator of GroEL
MIEKLSEGLDKSKIIFYMVDIDNNDELSSRLKIKSVPSFVLFKDNKLENELNRCTGSNISNVHQLLKQYL